MKKIIFTFFIGFLGFVCCTGSVFCAENWALGSSGAGSGPYVWGGTISKLINKHQSAIRLSSQATAGFNENVALVSSGDIQIGENDLSGLTSAYKGEKVFKGRPHQRIRLLFPIVVGLYHLVTRESAGIKTIYDLKGKKMNIGLPAQVTREVNTALLKAANIKLGDIKVFQMATGQSFRALQDGVIDASGNLYSVGSGRLRALAIKTRIRLISIPDEVLKRFEKSIEGTFRFTIPAHIYRGVNYPVNTFASPVFLFVRNDLPEDKVYLITKTFWENLDELKKSPVFKSLELGQAYLKDSKVPYHAGALRYFKEIGLVK